MAERFTCSRLQGRELDLGHSISPQIQPDDPQAGEHLHALQTLPMQVVAIKTDQAIVREGDSPSRACLILSGFAATYKMTGDGKRQIVSFNLPGDIPDLQSLHLTVIDNSISTIRASDWNFDSGLLCEVEL